ncbi:hypothetical protein BJY04DRAFT_182623 [Aspergillus karnatakaensis]|uniref:uncharacterized protein n=1 Tax=Aspergillus karnatakaensis TaxID=1810916 RepID=UPI003CCD9753
MSSPHRGGSLSDMAPKGTKIPNDAGLMNTIPSVPRPDQRSDHPDYEYGGIGQPSTAFAADNSTDLPRSTRDIGFTGEVMTGTGNTLPAQNENAPNVLGTNTPGAKGQTRSHLRGKQQRGGFERFAGEDEDAGEYIGEHEGRNAD